MTLVLTVLFLLHMRFSAQSLGKGNCLAPHKLLNTAETRPCSFSNGLNVQPDGRSTKAEYSVGHAINEVKDPQTEDPIRPEWSLRRKSHRDRRCTHESFVSLDLQAHNQPIEPEYPTKIQRLKIQRDRRSNRACYGIRQKIHREERSKIETVHCLFETHYVDFLFILERWRWVRLCSVRISYTKVSVWII